MSSCVQTDFLNCRLPNSASVSTWRLHVSGDLLDYVRLLPADWLSCRPVSANLLKRRHPGQPRRSAVTDRRELLGGDAHLLAESRSGRS